MGINEDKIEELESKIKELEDKNFKQKEEINKLINYNKELQISINKLTSLIDDYSNKMLDLDKIKSNNDQIFFQDY